MQIVEIKHKFYPKTNGGNFLNQTATPTNLTEEVELQYALNFPTREQAEEFIKDVPLIQAPLGPGMIIFAP